MKNKIVVESLLKSSDHNVIGMPMPLRLSVKASEQKHWARVNKYNRLLGNGQ